MRAIVAGKRAEQSESVPFLKCARKGWGAMMLLRVTLILCTGGFCFLPYCCIVYHFSADLHQ